MVLLEKAPMIQTTAYPWVVWLSASPVAMWMPRGCGAGLPSVTGVGVVLPLVTRSHAV